MWPSEKYPYNYLMLKQQSFKHQGEGIWSQKFTTTHNHILNCRLLMWNFYHGLIDGVVCSWVNTNDLYAIYKPVCLICSPLSSAIPIWFWVSLSVYLWWSKIQLVPVFRGRPVHLNYFYKHPSSVQVWIYPQLFWKHPAPHISRFKVRSTWLHLPECKTMYHPPNVFQQACSPGSP